MKNIYKRRALTGLETAIILVAFVITAAAFAFVVLNMGFLTAEKDDSKLVATYTNPRCHGEIYNSNGTIMTVQGVNSDGDTLLEPGEKFKVTVEFNEINMTTGVDPAQASMDDVYTHPYETFRIELRPAQGAVLTIERKIPAVYNTIMSLN